MRKYSFSSYLIMLIMLSICILAASERTVTQTQENTFMDVAFYQKIMQKISTPSYRIKIRFYVGIHTFMHYEVLLKVLHAKLVYVPPNQPIEWYWDPIQIMEYGRSRCASFAITYAALCLAYGWRARLILDRSLDGDHVWVEVFDMGKWVHVDPTEKVVNQPLMYKLKWGKSLTHVFAVEANRVERVESRYTLFSSG